LDKAMKTIEWSLKKLEEKGKLDEPHEDIVKRITKTTVMDLGKDTDIVIEAINEAFELPTIEAMERASKLYGEVYKTRDSREGISAHLEKRRPRFTGQ